jgi:putative copper export protein
MSPPLLILARFLHDASALLLGGVVAFHGLYLRPAFRVCNEATWRGLAGLRARFDLLVVGALVGLVLAGLLLFWTEAAQMSDSTMMMSLDRETWGSVFFETRFGVVVQVRLSLVAALVLLLGFARWRGIGAKPQLALTEISTGVVSAALVISLAWNGHSAAVSGNATLHVIVAAFHLLAAAVWPAGLLPLLIFISHIRAHPRSVPLASLRCLVRRFSNTSVAVVVLLTTTGFLNAWFILKTWPAVLSTYGLVLGVKITLLAGILGVAACNRLRNVPAIAQLRESSAPAALDQIGRSLQRFVAAEFVVAVAVILVSSLLGSTAPPQ